MLLDLEAGMQLINLDLHHDAFEAGSKAIVFIHYDRTGKNYQIGDELTIAATGVISLKSIDYEVLDRCFLCVALNPSHGLDNVVVHKGAETQPTISHTVKTFRIHLDDPQLTVGGTSAVVAYDLSGTRITDHIFYSSSDETIATVGNDGAITAKGVGTVTITVRRGKEKHSVQLVVIAVGSGGGSSTTSQSTGTNSAPLPAIKPLKLILIYKAKGQ